jgi:GH25 family lysozyme M1 (1,4-beta-N-acetylmuramidase)
MATVNGIDISRWQGAFDWKAHPGLNFGMAKATEGTGLTDPEFGNNWDAMWDYQADHRLPRFAYSYFHSALDPVQQAEFLVLTAKKHGLLEGDNFVLDVEATDDETGLNDEEAPAVTAKRSRWRVTVPGSNPGICGSPTTAFPRRRCPRHGRTGRSGSGPATRSTSTASTATRTSCAPSPACRTRGRQWH